MAIAITIFRVKEREAYLREIVRKHAPDDYGVVEEGGCFLTLKEKDGLPGKEMTLCVADKVIWADGATYFISALLKFKNIAYTRTSRTFENWSEVRSAFKREYPRG